MRIRTLAVIALLALPCDLSAQRIPFPRIGRGTRPQPAPLPPEVPEVTRALAYKRSRWTAEAYSLISTLQMPAANGATTTYSTVGTGTHADYRYSEHFSASVDLTASLLGSPAMTQTAELGTRYRALSPEEQIRPFFDLRGGFMHSYDEFPVPTVGSQFGYESRYGRGFGGIVGTGVDYSLARSWALSVGVSAMRNRMTAYRLDGPASFPNGTSYWMTSLRYAIGIKYNQTRALALKQNPRQ